MSISRNTAIMLSLFSGLLSMFALPGCSRHHEAAYESPPAATISPAPSSHIVRRADRDYYVDSQGALHLISRRSMETEGGLYYLEGDERAYVLDQSGRLYYREPSGRILYYEEVTPVQTVVVPSQPTYMAAPVTRESCESQYQQCVSGCNGISPRQRADRPNCMSNCEAIRSGCPGR
jgi:hypothetical protein